MRRYLFLIWIFYPCNETKKSPGLWSKVHAFEGITGHILEGPRGSFIIDSVCRLSPRQRILWKVQTFTSFFFFLTFTSYLNSQRKFFFCVTYLWSGYWLTDYFEKKKQRHYFVSKGLFSQGYGFSNGHVWMWELDYKESWAPKNWCFWTVVFGKTLESPLDFKKIQPVHPKRDQSWVLVGRTDVEAETPILWPPDAKSWLIGKDPDAGKDWGQEEKGTTEDGMVGWHHRLYGHGFVWVDSGSWWWTGRPGVLRFMGLQRIRHDWATELNYSSYIVIFFRYIENNHFILYWYGLHILWYEIRNISRALLINLSGCFCGFEQCHKSLSQWHRDSDVHMCNNHPLTFSASSIGISLQDNAVQVPILVCEAVL